MRPFRDIDPSAVWAEARHYARKTIFTVAAFTGAVLLAPTAADAAVEDCRGDYPDGCGPENVLPPVDEGEPEEPGEETHNYRPDKPEEEPDKPIEHAETGTLPLTGGDVVGIAVIGTVALGLGTELVRRSKRAHQQ